jgi:hypothetical protein
LISPGKCRDTSYLNLATTTSIHILSNLLVSITQSLHANKLINWQLKTSNITLMYRDYLLFLSAAEFPDPIVEWNIYCDDMLIDSL